MLWSLIWSCNKLRAERNEGKKSPLRKILTELCNCTFWRRIISLKQTTSLSPSWSVFLVLCRGAGWCERVHQCVTGLHTNTHHQMFYETPWKRGAIRLKLHSWLLRPVWNGNNLCQNSSLMKQTNRHYRLLSQNWKTFKIFATCGGKKVLWIHITFFSIW